MNAIDRAGTFRGKLAEWGVSQTKNGYPQFVGRLQALEYYDEDAGQYISWAEYEQEMTGYFVLYTKDKSGQWQELLNAKQLKAALGWSGKDFESLAGGDYNETMVLFRVEPNEYNGTTSLKVSWIDKADANPVKTLPKFDAAKLAALTASMGGALASSTPAPTPAKAPTGKPATPPKGKKPTAARPTVAASAPAPSTGTPPPVGAPASVPPAPAASPSISAPPPTTPPAPDPKATTPVTKESAWAAVNGPMKDVTDEKLAEVWIAEGAKIGKDEKDFSSDDWAAVQEAVMKQTAKF